MSDLKLMSPETQAIVFYFEGAECGKLFPKDGKLAFEGDVDKSAEAFFKAVGGIYTDLREDLTPKVPEIEGER